MTSLSIQVERLLQHSKSIKNAAAETAHNSNQDGDSIAGPFTRALLQTALGDLIRDVDSSELGLFTLTRPTNDQTGDPKSGTTGADVERVQFSGATPLRKPRAHADNPRLKEPAPEIFAQAALKYIDRYHPIRPMPRAYEQVHELLERLSVVRENIRVLTERLKQPQEEASAKLVADREERKVQDLQTKLASLRSRKEAAMNQQKPRHPPNTSPKPEQQSVKKQSPPLTPNEAAFFLTPAATAKTFRFTDNLLMDEEGDLGNISGASLTSPVPRQLPMYARAFDQSMDHDEDTVDGGSPIPPAPIQRLDEAQFIAPEEGLAEEGAPPRHSPSPKGGALPTPSTPVVDGVPSLHRKIKITTEVERIVAKIWNTAGDIIMPGHPFNTTGNPSGIGSSPPHAKETIAHLRSLSIASFPPPSPSASSISSASAAVSQPSSQQILTAQFLLALLSSTPGYKMPLNEVKDILAAKASSEGASAQSTVRIVYGCVAKRLVKIERGGGEQLVKFDI